MQKYANIIINLSVDKLDRTFQYIIPETLSDVLHAGSIVKVPFGRGNRLVKGYVMELTDETDFDPAKMKEIDSLDSSAVTVSEQLMILAWWMKNRYGCTMSQALKTVMPVKTQVKPVIHIFIRRAVSYEELTQAKEEAEKKKYRAQARLLEAFQTEEVLEQSVIVKKLNISVQTINALVQKNILTVEKEEALRNPVHANEKSKLCICLNEEQNNATEAIWADYQTGNPHTWLLHGITGSGKTEVYLELIDRVLKEGKQAIVLIPEISLTYQTVQRFYNRFGNQVSIVNSRMSPGEKYDQFLKAQKGEISIMVGPRSALFTPFEHLGLIIIDEEHEDSYKSDTAPKYHAREVAIERAGMNHAMVLLGSATPSMESYYFAENGIYRKAILKNRGVSESFLPKVEIVDLRKELKEHNHSIISRSLHEKITERLAKKEQVMLFLNRRGYSNFMSCRNCGEVIKCPNCDISLTLHEDGTLRCHYCGYRAKANKTCPYCRKDYVSGFGIGTEKAVRLVQSEFPDARILRMDVDSTSRKGTMEEILSTFANGDADILVGTQMIVKGHDFPNVTLVGMLVADLSLNASTYRAGEKTFQLLTQAAGRAGRRQKPGEVVIQTYRPEHFSIVCAAKQNYEMFFRQELTYRRMQGYPPVTRMMIVLVTAPVEKDAEEAVKEAADLIRKSFDTRQIRIDGPMPDTIGKINNIYRRIFYLRSSSLPALHRAWEMIEKSIIVDKWPQLMIQCDFS